MPIRIEELVLKTVVLDRKASIENVDERTASEEKFSFLAHRDARYCLDTVFEDKIRRGKER